MTDTLLEDGVKKIRVRVVRKWGFAIVGNAENGNLCILKRDGSFVEIKGEINRSFVIQIGNIRRFDRRQVANKFIRSLNGNTLKVPASDVKNIRSQTVRKWGFAIIGDAPKGNVCILKKDGSFVLFNGVIDRPAVQRIGNIQGFDQRTVANDHITSLKGKPSKPGRKKQKAPCVNRVTQRNNR